MSKNSSPNSSKAKSPPVDRLEQILRHFEKRTSSKKLIEKVCILTGVGNEQGIGWATAVQFASEAAKHLYLLDMDGNALPKLSDKIRDVSSNTGVSTYVGDASDEGLIKKICQQALDDHGHLDVFFANAGIATGSPLEATSYKTAEKILKINTLSCWLALKYASSTMLRNQKDESPTGIDHRGGSIILTASVAGLRSGAGSVDYSASKAAVASLAMTGANAYPGANIRVNAICPGLIQTQMTGPIFELSRDKSKIGQLCSLRRYGIADEVASAVLFLASEDSSYVNGAVVPVDGGLSSSVPVIPGKSY
ncbi:hypothetical protein CROQUDRAFT_659788 [Cronartium quercuum f. sp. fusiforme G11]|uniref:NAD(P)-binding protein n=1 Tax=Cronartium quercuum f. sp. fusiforme G11 TaxID=708437 RepID=A0A9P6TBG3_9BASI|nr:hypothetical protein CROQUDRAFT_659788 [Cronartium quercuum f. sp. fusiforme G11]